MTFTPTDYLPYDFANRRHIGPSPAEMEAMLKTLGVASLDELIDQTIPSTIRQAEPLDFGKPRSEREMLWEMRQIADRNEVFTTMIGQGYHGTVTPPAIQRNILENPAWYTAYTPYQPEISQGRLEALLNYQTMISDLTGLEIANASLLDEATAAAEAMTMAERTAKSKAKAFFIDENCHPQNIAVMRTRAEPLDIEVIVGSPDDLEADKVFGAIFQYPGTYGHVRDFTPQIEALHAAGALGIVIADPLALTLLKEPGAMGADIAVGSTQRFGVPLGFGGPHAAYMACKDGLKRAMPGRLVGVSIDARGNKAYRLSLQTREQHIRREKATSNVCTAQALLAVMASFYAVFHGPEGLKAIAQRVHRKTERLVMGLEAGGYAVEPKLFFDTITVEVGPMQGVIMEAGKRERINFRRVGTTKIGMSVDESLRPATIEAVWRAFGLSYGRDDFEAGYTRLPQELHRTSEFLTHPIFHLNRAETEMMRYMRRLADRDLALDRAMIPLGSCTMKLNAAVEMMPVTWPQFSNIHPFAPAEQVKGYTAMIEDLCARLCTITGYDAMSMQPNSGAQGEYAGLLTIMAYHRARGDGARKVCLIPVSAHGTNPASAQMCGMEVVVVKSAANGDVDVDDFRAKAEAAGNRLAACMITYPSTHGVFEETVSEVCEITHAHGGQVYIDGANLNAMVGLAKPGDVGGDVSHLNLHKTFCIPHGGGGPGMGPIGVKAHLAPFLPGHPHTGGREGPVSAAPYGSPGILVIPYAYLLLMGGAGLTQATRVAILNANYIAKRLEGAFDVLFKGRKGRVAHECILDTRPFADSAGVTVDDIAKRLIDNGFHAPTMSWPVPGTLMVEPTESETKAELDRFCDAMLHIREEIRAVETGEMERENNPLKNAPHTVEDLVGDWDRPYSREAGCYPKGAFRVDKYWPPVNRVDNAWGDRHLVCTCPPLEDYAQAAE
ncbi:glycine dehydrogenase (aminomethyl-transferring) [Silicimonas algicola]|uniref:Glycine dehydrogenase (decarboxylating) n=1 Tax=Silicimonas algicola TaxID=1826607 RepID=A0A316G5Z3_9RHOB|nr:aminomethyl-transferring glycine dehydrogenase [Silicimonas algicola]AZQ68891.1 glycine dehydrogenase (aminomethyl-transferring) [Silicimonas algicola]PWK56012.1 glycine dehydrogenase (decarboxylating) [Silicimonas algicola]